MGRPSSWFEALVSSPMTALRRTSSQLLFRLRTRRCTHAPAALCQRETPGLGSLGCFLLRLPVWLPGPCPPAGLMACLAPPALRLRSAASLGTARMWVELPAGGRLGAFTRAQGSATMKRTRAVSCLSQEGLHVTAQSVTLHPSRLYTRHGHGIGNRPDIPTRSLQTVP